MKKVIFIDVDGTIYKSHQLLIDQSVDTALKKLSEYADIYLATGRCMAVTAPIGEAMAYFKGYVLANGAYVLKDGKAVLNETIEKDELKEFIKIAKGMKLNIGLITNDLVFVNEYTPIVDSALSPYLKDSVKDIHGYDFDLDLKYNMAWCFDSKEKIDAFSKKTSVFDVFHWGNVGGDLIIKGISKAYGIKKLLETLDHEDIITYAIGDSNNDLAMFDLVDVAICMANGSTHALAKAKYVTDDIYNEGFEKAVDKIIKGEW